MSHSLGIIFSKEENSQIIAYFEYDGTSDICLPQIFKTKDEVIKRWRQEQDWSKCICNIERTKVWIHSEYGGEFYWDGEICINCKRITSSLSDFGDTHNYCRPDNKPTGYKIIMEGLKEELYYPNGTL